MKPAFGLIIIGDEILSGKRLDKHQSRVIEMMQLRAWSGPFLVAVCVGDERRAHHRRFAGGI
jgi:molybdopterin-biosynthesis enzyme MoeA-like protein